MGNDQAQQQSNAGSKTSTGAPSDEMGEFVSAVLGSTEAQWTDIFAQTGKRYTPPTLVMFSGATQSGCGFAQAAMGPFYCPIDQKVYLDTSFFQDLERRFHGCDVGSKTCQFSQAYMIAHEVGHHVQNQLGVLPQVQEQHMGWTRRRPIACKSTWNCRRTALLASMNSVIAFRSNPTKRNDMPRRDELKHICLVATAAWLDVEP